ncbi:MAG: fatty acid synthase subunit beta domain-containing protein, partial [Microthrixaceae bacterium]
MTVSTLTPSFDAPRFVTREPIAGSLVHRLSVGSATAALTFAGQGWPWWEDLTSILERRSWLRPTAQRWAGMIADIAATPAVRDLGASSRGFDPLRWAESGEVPSAAELAALPLSMPGVLLTQLLAYREAWEDGLWSAVENGSIVAATGHSGGILAAGAVASDPQGLDDDNAPFPFLQVAVHLGHMVGASRESVGLSELTSALSGNQDAGTPMVAVAGMRTDRIAHLLAQNDGGQTRGNLARAPRESARIALHHGPYRAVLSGTPASLDAARRVLTKDIADSRSGTRLVWEPLAVSAPCHHPILGAVTASLVDALHASGVTCVIPAEGLDVLNPAGPAPFARGVDVTEALVASMLTNTSHWYQSVSGLADGSLGTRPADWILDLGPSDGISKLTEAGVRGSGARVLALSDDSARRKLVTAGATPQQPERSYESYAPTVVRVPGGQIRLENAFTRATGRSPMVLPGMTPTTVDAPIVAAAANSGFLAELAGGGQVTREIFAERLVELGELLDPGQEIVFNALHLDPYLWNLHLGGTRLVQEARRAGAPICGVTVSAGIPEVDDAVALLDELAGLDMWCNAFKPGTAAQIRQVLAIADAAPKHTVFMHVEGGTAGGHHSWVDLEDLLLGSYHQIRTRPNVVLCVGGGIGTPERAAELLTGKWALDHVGRVMPVDAVLLGTVAMATAEATATYGAKLALAAATGSSVGNSTRRSGGGPDGGPAGGAGFVAPGEFHGGVTSGRSGLDADIHFLDNSASRCAALLDEVAGNSEAVESRRDEIIASLARTAKPYFGDVSAMTYESMLRRFVELTAIGRQGRYEDGAWLDTSHRQRFIALLQRAEARLDPAETGDVATIFDLLESVDDPAGAIGALLDAHPAASDTPLHPADAGFFLAVCRRPGKPVPFVPVIDADVRRWYQSDSLWQAQHPNFDADATLIIPGPVAVSGITTVDEPVADLLTRFEAHVVETLSTDQVCDGTIDVGSADGERNGWSEAGPSGESDDGLGIPLITRLQRRGPTAEMRGPVAALLEARTVVVGTSTRPNPVLAFGDVGNWQLVTDESQRLTRATMRLDGPGRTSEVVTLEVSSEDPDEVAVLTIGLPTLQGYGEPRADYSDSGDSQDMLSLEFR